jgi:hypothetical protein
MLGRGGGGRRRKSPTFSLAPAVYLTEFYNLKWARYRLGEEKSFQLVARGSVVGIITRLRLDVQRLEAR